MFKCFLFLICILFSLNILAQRHTPLSDSYLRTDMNANFKNITNINNLVFHLNNSNLIVNLDTFLQALSGESTKVLDPNEIGSYLYVSNGSPYILNAGEVTKVILETDGVFIRQYDTMGVVSNMIVIQDLKIQYPSDIDDSDYAVTYHSLTNGAIDKLRIGRYVLMDLNGILLSSNIFNNVTTQLAP